MKGFFFFFFFGDLIKISQSNGSNRVGMVREEQFFFQVRKFLYQLREILKLILLQSLQCKVREFCFWLATRFEKGFPCWLLAKVMLF